MSGTYDQAWLQNQLEIMLGWDPMMAQGVSEALATMDDPDEIEALIENVLSDAKARQAAEKFLTHKANKGGANKSTPSSSQVSSRTQQSMRSQPQQSASSKQKTIPKQQQQQGPGKKKGPQKVPAKNNDNDDDDDGIGIFVPKAREKLTRQDKIAAQKTQSKPKAQPQQQPQQQQQSQAKHPQQTMSINEAMSRPKKGSKKPKSTAIVRGEIALAQQLERKVMNCVKCGKVFDCRKVDEDVYHLLDKNGLCTFCGNKIKLVFIDGTTNWSEEDEQELQQYLGGEAVLEASSKATNLKNQLVDYDRHSAKRTQVIDDHSDFYEIDSNAWLTEEERKLMRERQRQEEEEAEARRNKISFTVDLMGRRVMLANKDDDLDFDIDEKKQKLLKVAEVNKQVAPQGGGTSIKATLQAAQELDKRNKIDENIAPELVAPQRIAPNPTLKGPKPIFLPTGEKQTSLKKKMQEKAQQKAQAARKSEWSSRIQDDDIFDDFMSVIEVKYEDESQAFKVAQKTVQEMDQGTFDLCDNYEGGKKQKGVGPTASPMSTRSSTSKVHAEYNRINELEGPREIYDPYELPQGMVWLKQWMPLQVQVQIIQEIRKLGMGSAGFYQPSFTSGARHSMLMMCLGKHYEVRTGKYESTRSSYDGAIPPPIPDFLQDIVQHALYNAYQVSGFRFPEFKPDIAICNYYPPNKGSLGVHQDISEGPETLKRGLPVVSLSFGDVGDFVFGKTRDVNLGGLIQLRSGDVLVFGGPSRTIFHGVPKVHSNTAPQELLRLTQMKPGRLNITFRQSRL